MIQYLKLLNKVILQKVFKETGGDLTKYQSLGEFGALHKVLTTNILWV